MRGPPAEFAVNLRGVNRVAAVVAGAVFHEGNELARTAAELRGEFINEVADEFHDAEVGPFVVAADAVGLASAPAQEGLPEGLRVVGHVEPVAHVHAVAINRDGLAGGSLVDDDRNELLGELARAVVVRAVGRDHVEAVSVVIRANEQVAGGLAGRVRRVRRVGRGLGEVAGRAEAAEDFVGADVDETGLGSGVWGLGPDCAAGFEQVESANDVGLDEIARAFDGAVHVRLGGEVQNVGDGVFAHDPQHGGFVPQVLLLEAVFRAARGGGDVFEAAGVGEAVEVDDTRDLGLRQHVVEHVGADEAAAASDQEMHER